MKKIIAFISGATLAGIMLLLTYFSDVFDLREKLKPPPSVSTESMKIEYLPQQDDDMDDLKFLYGADLSQSERIELGQNCITKVSIQNKYDSDVELQKIIFEATNIKEDKSPKLTANVRQSGDNQLALYLINNGWEKAKDITVTFKCDEIDLSEVINEEKLKMSISEIDAAQEIAIPFWENKDVLIDYKNGEMVEVFAIGVVFSDQTGKVIAETQNYIKLSINKYGISIAGTGGPAENFYGIKLDTSKEECHEEENISEIITGGEILVMPISFFPTSTCSMDFRIGFEIWHKGKKKVVYSEYKKLNFFVPSNKIYAETNFDTRDSN